MKKLLAALTLLTGIMMSGKLAVASDIVLPSSSVVNSVLVATRNIDVDLNQSHADALSVQVIYSSASPSAITFSDGTTSTASIRVADLTSLTTAYATNSITITTTAALSGANIYFNGDTLKEGLHWNRGASTVTAAVAICNMLNRRYASVIISTVGYGSTVVYSTAVTVGSAANAYTLSSSTPAAIACNSATFTGGQDNATINIANVTLQVNRDFFVGATSVTTAGRIAAAINASSQLSRVMIATNTSGVVNATSTVVGIQSNFPITISTPTALVASANNFIGGADSDITLTTAINLFGGLFNYTYATAGSLYGVTNTIKKTPTGFGTGTELLLTKTSGTMPGGLTVNTTYFVSNQTATSFQLADTSTGAVAGIAIAITTTTQTGGGSFVLTPLAPSGTPTFKLQKSNDGTNFQDIYVSTQPTLTPIAASVSFASPYTAANQIWDLGKVYFRYLRLVFTAGTHGGVNMNYVLNGRRE